MHHLADSTRFMGTVAKDFGADVVQDDPRVRPILM